MSSETDINDELTLDQIAESFLNRLRSGERPSIQEYVAKYPELAGDIEELFPTLASLEQYDAGSSRSMHVSDFKAPQKLGDYHIIREVGRGGMGVVYEALHETMQRRVALKVLPHTKSGKKDYTKRFLREARAAGQLHHTNIVPVFEVGEADGIHYYAMQFIHGQNLDIVLDELRRLEAMSTESLATLRATTSIVGAHNSVSESTTAFWNGTDAANVGAPNTGGVASDGDSTSSDEAEASSQWSRKGNSSASYFKRVAMGAQQVADALGYAHSHGVLHRDIKPSNLLLDTEGVIWVSDFGLAKDDSEDLTHTGDIIGTLRYMAPERFTGTAGVSSDIYSIGLTLYEMCTMRYAFDESDRARLMQQIASRDPVAPRRFRPEIPRDLETIILKSIARDPGARYLTARQLADDLGRFVADKPVLARRVSLAERAWRWCRRNPSYALLFGCVALMAALVVLGAVGFGVQSLRHADELRGETIRALQAESEARQASLESTRSLYKSYVGFANASRWSRRRGQRFETLDQLRMASALLPKLDWSRDDIAKETQLLRNAAIAALPLVDIREIRSWPTNTFARAGLSADGSMAAWSEDDGALVVRNVDSQKVVAELQGPSEQVWVVGFDPSGRFIAGKFHDDVPPTPPKLIVWEIATGQKLLDVRERLGNAAFAFHPTSDEFVVCRKSGELAVYSLGEAKQVRTLSIGSDVLKLQFDPFGLLSYERGNEILSTEYESGQSKRISFPAPVHTFEWKSNGDLVVGGRDGKVYVRSAQSEEIRSFGSHTANVVRALLSPRENLLITEAWGGSRLIHDLRTGDLLLNLEGLNIDGISRSRNRVGLSRSFNTHGVWELAAGEPIREILTGDDRRHWDIVPHPEFESLVALSADGGVEIWDIERETLIANAPGKEVTQIAFSPAGDQLFTASAGAAAPMVYDVSATKNQLERFDVVIDPPRPIPELNVKRPAGRSNHLALDQMGRTLAVLDGLDSAHVLRLASDAVPVVLKGHPMISRIAISPDGNWVVTASWHGEGIRLWNASTGELTNDLAPDVGTAWPAFSPNGKWLMVTSKENDYIWDTATWTRRTIDRGDQPGYEGRITFSPSSDLAVIWQSRVVPRLVDPESGQEIAVLEAPNRRGGVPVFTSSGRKLVLASSGCMQVWDVAALRSELSELGLDW